MLAIEPIGGCLVKTFSITRNRAGELRLKLLDDGVEMGGGCAPDTPEDRSFLEDHAYEWGATEQVPADGGVADALSTP